MNQSVANLRDETQIFTQTNSGCLRFYSEFSSKNLAGGVSGLNMQNMRNMQNMLNTLNMQSS